jgi:hypothetical protein
VEADALAVNLNGVAVDDRGHADDGGSLCNRRDRRPLGWCLRRRKSLGRLRCSDWHIQRSRGGPLGALWRG